MAEPPRVMAILLGLLVALTIAQSVRARNFGDGVSSLCLGLSGPILAFSLAGNPSLRGHLLKRLSSVVLVSAIVLPIAGIWQFLDFRPNGCVSVPLVFDIAGFSAPVPSLFTHGNYGGTFAAMLIPLGSVGALQAKGRPRQILWFLALLLLAGYLLLSRSRGGLVSACFGMAVLGILLGKSLWRGSSRVTKPAVRFSLIAFAIGCGCILAWILMTQESQQGGWTAHLKTKGTVSGRLTIWKMSLRMVPDHPVFGVGLGNYLPAFFRYRDPDFAFFGLADRYLIQETPDSALIQVLCEFGPAGLLLLGAIGTFALINFVRRRYLGVPEEEHFWLAGLFAMLGVFALAAVFTSVCTQVCHLTYAWMGVGMLAGCGTGIREMPGWRRYATAFMSLLLIPMLALSVFLSVRLISARNWEGRFIAGGFHDLPYLDRSIALYPWDISRCLRAGKWYLEAGDFQRSKGEFSRALAWQPENPHVLTRMGDIYRLTKMPAEASASYRESLRWAPRWALTIRGLAQLHLDLGRYVEARRELAEMIELEPDWAEGLYLRGVAAAFLGDYQSARQDFRKSVALSWPVQASLRHRTDEWLKQPEFSEFH